MGMGIRTQETSNIEHPMKAGLAIIGDYWEGEFAIIFILLKTANQ